MNYFLSRYLIICENAYDLLLSITGYKLQINRNFMTYNIMLPIFVVQSLSYVQLFATPQTAAWQPYLSFTIPQSLSNSCSLSWWCHLTIWISVIPFFSCPQSFPAPGSFPVLPIFIFRILGCLFLLTMSHSSPTLTLLPDP